MKDLPETSKKEQIIQHFLNHIRSELEQWEEVKCTCRDKNCNGSGLIDEKGTFYHMGPDGN